MKNGAHTVIKLTSVRDEKEYALKKLPVTEVKEVQREVLVPSCLNHPNIMPVDLAFVEGGYVYVQTAWCQNGDVRAWLKSAPRSVAECCAMLGGVLHGIAYIHDHDVVHGDLKPGNVLMDNGRPRISDWGVCRLRLGVTTLLGMATTTRMLTPEYAAPELLANPKAQTSFATDMFAMGRMIQAVVSSLETSADAGSPKIAQLRAAAKQCMTDDPQARPSATKLLDEYCIFHAMTYAKGATLSRNHVQWEHEVQGKVEEAKGDAEAGGGEGLVWVPYDDKDNMLLEATYTRFKEARIRLAAFGEHNHQRVSDGKVVVFSEMKAVAADTGWVRVRRALQAQ